MKKPIKVLMFGWEFPPFNSGGLGTACYGLIHGFSQEEVEVTFVLPKELPVSSSLARITFADRHSPSITVTAINSLLKPYINSHSYDKLRVGVSSKLYGLTLFEEVKLYSLRATELAQEEEFDIIHAHDWLSFGAGLAAKRVSGKPLVAHVHATEFDRTGGIVNGEIYEMEKCGLKEADKIITVSDFTKRIIVDRYGIIPDKIAVVYNGIEISKEDSQITECSARLKKLKSMGKKIVLFVGRITLQKGPDYFLKVARRVLEYHTDVIFVIAGSGDMERQMVREVAELGISDKVIFAGFVRGEELNALYRTADLFVMPSVSEPFGLTALEAVKNGAPVIISKQSGVSEVIKNAIKVDFWDIDATADAIMALLSHEPLSVTLRQSAREELPLVSWKRAAQTCVTIYKELMHPLGNYK